MNKTRKNHLLLKLKAIALTLVIGCILHSGSAVAQPDFGSDKSAIGSDTKAVFSDFNRYLFSSSAIGVPKGHFFYNNNMILLNSFIYGVTDVFSVQAGFLPPFLFGDNMPVFIKPELRLPLENSLVNFSMGFYVFAVLGRSTDSLHYIYGKTTIGTSEYNISVSLGYASAHQDDGLWSGNTSPPLIGIFTHLKLHDQFSFVSESYLPADTDKYANIHFSNQFSLTALRYHPGRSAMDFGLMYLTSRRSFNTNNITLSPYIGFTILF